MKFRISKKVKRIGVDLFLIIVAVLPMDLPERLVILDIACVIFAACMAIQSFVDAIRESERQRIEQRIEEESRQKPIVYTFSKSKAK